jgi:adenylosuccinate lyase
MATENIIMEAVKKGADRQIIHERIRIHSMEASKQVKEKGLPNDLLQRIASDSKINLKKSELDAVLNSYNFIGRATQQTTEYIKEHIDPLIARGKKLGPIEKTDLYV